MSKIRAIRFPPKEDELIRKFLDQNPVLDFSSLARVAILNFIKAPELKLQRVVTSIEEEFYEQSNDREQ